MMSALLLHRLMTLMLANVLKGLTSIQNHTTSLPILNVLNPRRTFSVNPLDLDHFLTAPGTDELDERLLVRPQTLKTSIR